MTQIIEKMDIGHWILIIGTITGYTFAIYQMKLKHKLEKKVKKQERRYQAYKRLMDKIGEVNSNLRLDENNPFKVLLESKNSMENIMERLNIFIKKPLDSLSILETEIDSVKLDSSLIVYKQLEELKIIVRKLNDYLTPRVHLINSDPNGLLNQIMSLTKDESITRIKTLSDEIIFQMRKEIETED